MQQQPHATGNEKAYFECHIPATDREIDQRVYRRYGVGEEEIKAVEGSDRNR